MVQAAKDSQSFGKDIQGGVRIPVVNGATPRTSPLPIGEGQYGPLLAFVAGFGGRVEPAYLHHLPTAPSGFVLQLPKEGRQRRIAEGLG